MTRRLATNHDLILVYSKSDSATWNSDEAHVAYVEDDLDERTEAKYNLRDSTGRRYQLTSLINPNNDRPNLTYEFLGVTRVWRWTRERMEKAYADGLVVQTRPGAVPRYKRYLDEQRGKAFDDVWTDVRPVNARAAERLGYPTQKPEKLLDRIIRLSSNPGDVVLDPFCGCGTSIAVAHRLKRQWVGIDISPTAMDIMKWRMNKYCHIYPRIVGAPETVEDLRRLKPFEFQNWVVGRINGSHSPRKSGDLGIDGYTFMKREPIQVKQSEKVGRNVVDNFETAMRRGKHTTGYIVAFSFTKDAVEEVARAKWNDHLEIILVPLEDLVAPPKQKYVGSLFPAEGIVIELPTIRRPDELPSADEVAKSAAS